MHELSLAQSVGQIVEDTLRQQPSGTRLTGLNLEVGELAGVELSTFETALRTVMAADGHEEQVVHIARVPGEASCLQCGSTFRAVGRFPVCPHCGSAQCPVTSGTELRVVSLTFATP